MQNPSYRSKKSPPVKAVSRLSKEQWLERALGLLEKRGPTAMTLDTLTSSMGVTTGSFYHHFGSHRRFMDELTDKYIHDYTYVVKEHLETLDLPPRELLIEVMRKIIANGLDGMDVHFRALAISYPRLSDKIRAMDDFRTSTITDLFKDMGYTGNELRMRVHVFVVLQSMESAITTCITQEDRLELLDERVKLLID